MPAFGRATSALLAALILLFAAPSGTVAQEPVPEEVPPDGIVATDGPADDSRRALEASGYVLFLTAIHDPGIEIPGHEKRTGFHGQVARLRWRVRVGRNATLSVHNRLRARFSSTNTGLEEVVGLGVSVTPGRAVDLSTRLLDREPIELWHDVDRLALRGRAGGSDVTLGRQAITWGLAHLFPVADLWAPFSPFELDTVDKPGVDAVRVLTYPATGIELDGVLAARGRARDWSAGLRATIELASGDVYAGAGKFWNQAMLLGGVAYVFDRATLRAEAVFPWDLDERMLRRPRVTVGADGLTHRFRLTGEYHHNGVGVTDPDGYLAQVEDPRLRRGESYLLGRHYLGGAVAYTADADARLSLVLRALWNLNDRSAVLTPILSYDAGQNASVSVGALRSIGAPPALTPLVLGSEFGTYGSLWFARLSLFF